MNYLELLSLSSFRAMGHSVAIYAYDPPENAPDGVEVRNARDLAPRDAAPAGMIGDYLRCRLLAARPGAIWAHPDFVLTRPLIPEDGVLIARQSARYLSPDILALPHESPALAALIAFTDQPHPTPPWASAAQRAALEAADPPLGPGDLEWGLWGARALTWFAEDSGEAEAASPQRLFYPLAYADRDLLLKRKAKVEDIADPGAAAIPLYARDLARQIMDAADGLPKFWTPIGALLRQYEIDPRAAPLFGVPAKAEGRWVVRGAGDASDKGKTPPADPAPAPAVQTAIQPAPQPKAAPAAPKAAAGPAPPPQKVCILTTMKNEGPFILEWIAYHRSIGIEGFIVYTNDCDDGTDELLDLLAQKGLITARIDNPFSAKSKAGDWQRAALWDAQAGDLIKPYDWVVPMDVDEFVNIHAGAGHWSDLMAALPDANMISMVWRLFGDGFRDGYADELYTEAYTWCARAECKRPALAWGFKTAFKPSDAYEKWSVHRPLGLVEEKADQIVWYSGSGHRLPDTFLNKGWRAKKEYAEYNLVSLNHYAVRNRDSYLVKRQRGRVNHIDEDQGAAYWFRMNHNNEQNTSIHNKLPGLKAELARLKADPDLVAAHEYSVAAHRRRIDELKERPDYQSLFTTVSSPRHVKYSRLTRHFGNRIFDIGPQAVPEDFAAWVDQLNDDLTAPPGLGPAPGVRPDGTLLPSEAFAGDVEARLAANRQMREDAAADLAAPDPVSAGDAPSGDPIYLGDQDDLAMAALERKGRTNFDMLAPRTAPRANDRVVIVSAMKNEGAFILEWVAYHRSIGVSDFLIYTNDCDDPTNEILDHLQGLGWVTRRDNGFSAAQGRSPIRCALDDAVSRELVTGADWVIPLDVDEFINIHAGDGRIPALVDAAQDPDALSMTWRLFGADGATMFVDRWVTEQFRACAPRRLPRPRRGWGLKTMYRPDAIKGAARIGTRRPLDIDPAAGLRWVNGSGRVMPDQMQTGSGWFSRKASIGYELVTLNHYPLLSAESFLVAEERGRFDPVDRDTGQTYWANRNYGTERDDSIQARIGPARAVWDGLMADARLAQAHADAVGWRRDRIAALKDDPAYAALYAAITAPDQRDAVYVAKEEPPDQSD